MWRQLLMVMLLMAAAQEVVGEKRTIECPAVCEPDKCPNIGPIKLSDCPAPYIKTDRCGCCERCEIVHKTTTISPSRRDEVCGKVTCPKKKLCMLNMQGIPVCKCPTLDLCTEAAGRKRNKVCGSDGITYLSRCHVKVASCQADKKIRAVSRGKCAAAKPTSDEELLSVLDTAEMQIDVTIDGLRQTQMGRVGQEERLNGITQEVSQLVSSTRREEGRRGRRKERKRDRKRQTNRRNRKKSKQNRKQKKLERAESLPL